jgi:peroxiredoxin
MFTNNAIASLILVLLLQGATQCLTQSAAPISGKVILSADWKPMVYLVQPRNFLEIASSFSGVVLGSAAVGPEGNFIFSKLLITEEKTLFQLCIQKAGNREKLPVLTGDQIPDFPLPMLAGDTINLHALLGARLTIVDIWASWCAPCRRENREVLSPLWAQQKAHGLQIIGYSIDSSPASWKAAITKDAATWPHASHLSGDATPFMEVLRITTIPANFILDAQGKVLAKNLHGEALRVFVENYLK